MVWISSAESELAPAGALPVDQGNSQQILEESLQMARAIGSSQPILVTRVVQRWIRERQAANVASVEACAILLLLLGERVSAEVFAHLNSTEVENIGTALLSHSVVPRERLNQVAEAFLSQARTLAVLADQPRTFLRSALLAAFDEPRAKSMEAAMLANQGRSVGDILGSLSDQAVAEQIRSEPRQVAAVMLAHLESQRAAAILSLLDEAMALELLSRLANARTIPPAALLDLRDGLVAALVAQDWARSQPHTGVAAAQAIAEQLHPQGLPAAWQQALRSRGPDAGSAGPK